MAEIDIFDVIGPIMIGPSSSHTAGAVRIGKIARVILGEPVKSANIYLHGSFAKTYRGHGTNLAIVAGLLGYEPDNEEIKEALKIAEDQGMAVEFVPVDLGAKAHPNTARLELTGIHGATAAITSSSTGGGSIVVTQIDQFNVDISGDYHALIVAHIDQPGLIAKVTTILSEGRINIAEMKVSREKRGSLALMVIETDQEVPDNLVARIEDIESIEAARMVKPI
ncbi:L-serine dehydratase [Desulfitispora alkaliphila]